MESKNDIRTEVKNLIDKMTESEKKEESNKVSQKLIAFLEKKDFRTLITYLPFADEVNITAVTNWFQEQGKSIIALSQGTVVVPIPQKSLIIVPGRVFTIEGKRIGRGGGFYDKLLANNPTLQSIGVCFSCQVFADIPQDTWDQPIDEVVFTENILE